MFAQSIQIEIDLVNVEKGNFDFTFFFPEAENKGWRYTLPGNAFGNNGRDDFIHDIEILDKGGERVVFKVFDDFHLIPNKSTEPHSIHYKVGLSEKKLSGLNGIVINPEKYFLLYPSYFIGYLNDEFDIPYEIKVKHSVDQSTSHSSLTVLNDSTDVIYFESYGELIGNPIIYSVAEKNSFEVEGMKINLSVFSEEGIRSAELVKKVVYPIVKNFKDSMGDLVLDEYNLNFCFLSHSSLNKLMLGGMFHKQDSYFILPEIKNSQKQNKEIRKMLAHELMHSLCPYHLHSEQLGELHFSKDKKMSKHLWFYEGVTEYLALQLLVRNGSISKKEFWDEMSEKYNRYQELPHHSLMTVSEEVFIQRDSRYFSSFYDKACLIALMLDIRLVNESSFRLDLLGLLKELAKKYGPDKPFEDDAFFDILMEAGSFSFKEILQKYVKGKKEIPLNEYLELAGLYFYEIHEKEIPSYGDFRLRENLKTKSFQFSQVKENVFGLKEGDILFRINGEIPDAEKYRRLLNQFRTPQVNDRIYLQVKRKGQIKDLSGQAINFKEPEFKVIRDLIYTIPAHTKMQTFLLGDAKEN